MLDVFVYLSVVLVLVVVMIGGAFLLRTFLTGDSPSEAIGRLFAPKPSPRLYVVEQSNVDSRRRLVLIRRDDIEHLIMTGGPVDVVIETGIQVREGVPQASPSTEISTLAVTPRTPLGS